jgi:hypothetical protein
MHVPQAGENGAADEGGELKTGGGFKFWLSNVLWYHYKVHIIVGLILTFVVIVSVHSMVTRNEPDYIIFIASGYPVFDDQGLVLAAYFEDKVEDASNIGHQVMGDMMFLLLALVGEQHMFFIIGESMLEIMSDQTYLFYTAEEMGIAASGPAPEMIPLEGSALIGELGFIHEPMYALIKRPLAGGDGSYEPASALRSRLAAESLKVLLEP